MMVKNPRKTALAIKSCLEELAAEADDHGLLTLSQVLERAALAADEAAMMVPRDTFVMTGHEAVH